MRFLSILTVAAVLALPAQASAQNNTGGAGWSVSVFDAGNNLLGSYTPYAPAGGHPSVWTTDANASWISAWDDFSGPGGVGDYNRMTDANHRYTYLFTYTFGSALGGGDIVFDMGWDNILKSFRFDNSAVLSPVSNYNIVGINQNYPVDQWFGFCRDGDAMFPSGNGVCTTGFKVPVLAGATSMTFELWGDGQTDGMWLAWDQTSIPTETVPEPATMTLLATGLAGLAGSSIRKRRARNTESK